MSFKQVREYDWIGKGAQVTLTDTQLGILDRLTSTLPRNVIEWQRNRLRFCGYCGVLQLGNLTLEVLPKIYGTESEPGKSRELLIRMLSAVRKLELHNTGEAQVKLQKHILLDIFILSFAERLERQLRQGMLHNYVLRSETLPTVRGKISIKDQIRYSASGQHNRIACSFEEFQTDNLQNRIIKATLTRLVRFVRSHSVRRVVDQLCGYYADVTDYFPVESDWTSLVFNRTNEDWQEILEQCRWFLNGMNPDVVSGDDKALSLLFAMNTLFEEYIAVELKKAIGDKYDVLAQKPQNKLLINKSGEKLFTMKPDIYIRNKTTQQPVAILDTKWKLLSGDDRKMGVSQADLYQMYTYAGSYHAKNVVLLYPRQSSLGHLDSEWTFIDQKTSLMVQQIDLEPLLKGRGVFREMLVKEVQFD